MFFFTVLYLAGSTFLTDSSSSVRVEVEILVCYCVSVMVVSYLGRIR